MSLHARIAIGSSRRVVLLERGVTVGAFVFVVATCAARWESPWPVVLGVVALATWVAVMRLGRRSPGGDALFVIGDHAEIDVHRGDDRAVEHLALDEDSLLWPGLAVLRLAAAPFSAAPSRDVIVFAGEVAPADGRHLRRYLMWVARGGIRPVPSVDRPS
jgi:hypothetical protein